MINKDRWNQVDSIYHAALAHEAGTRDAFLDEACGGDEEVRREVDSLLQFDGQAQKFIETPAVAVAARALAADEPPHPAPEQVSDIGPYHLLSIIGQGGTGDVYLAVDTRLDRRVAIKLLSADFVEDADRISRFKQEARTTSTLNHPNVVTIFEIGEIDGRHFIVTEYVEGETLRTRLAKAAANQLGIHDALSVATQVVNGLEVAHQAGIIHRDIKPENIIIRRDGLVKVLDFGIAKLAAFSSNLRGDHSTTHTGIVMGTASYMSPEQARGQKVDHRTDIFSVGVMLYEMLSGRRPFEGNTWSDVMAAVLIKEPAPLDRVSSKVPAALQRVVSRCLEKEPEKRFQSASDLAFALKEVSASTVTREVYRASQTARGEASTASRARIWLAVILILVGGVAATLYFKLLPLQKQVAKTGRPAVQPARPIVRLTWFDRSGRELGTVGEPDEYSGPDLSPEEDRVVVALQDPVAKTRDLWIYSLTSNARTRLTSDPAEDLNPLWSPDGKWIIFTSQKNGVRNLYRKRADGTGAVEAISPSAEEMNLEDISRDGKFLVFNVRKKSDDPPHTGLLSMPDNRWTTLISETFSRAARLSPDQRWIAYASEDSGGSGIFVRGTRAGAASKEKWLVSTRGKGATTPMWRGDGNELFYLEGQKLMAVEIATEGDRFLAAEPRALFSVNIQPDERRNRYVVTKDGQRFLFIVQEKTGR